MKLPGNLALLSPHKYTLTCPNEIVSFAHPKLDKRLGVCQNGLISKREQDRMKRKAYTIEVTDRNGKTELINIQATSDNHAEIIRARIQGRKN